MPKKIFLQIFIIFTTVIIFATLLLNKGILKDYFPHKICLDIHSLILTIACTVFLISLVSLLVKYDKLIIPGIIKKLSQLKHLILDLSTVEKIYISFLAGFSEELIFRGFLQALLGIGITSILFGAIHFLTFGYFLLATGIGFLLGWAFSYSGNILVQVLVHGIYNVFALNLLAKIYLKEEKTPNQWVKGTRPSAAHLTYVVR